MKNKIHTLAYFKKRLKDSGYVVWDIMNKYGQPDPRKWTIMINPSVESVFVTCIVNREEPGVHEFEINDSGHRFQRNLMLRTSSMEVIVNFLSSKGIVPDALYKVKSDDG